MISMKSVTKKGISTISSKIDQLSRKEKILIFVIFVCNLQMRKNKIIVFLVLPKLFSLEKTIFATTSGLNTYVQNTASSNCSKSCNSVIPYDFSKQCTCGLPFFTSTFSLETFHAHIIFIVCIYCTYILVQKTLNQNEYV